MCNTPPNADPPLCRLGDPDGVGTATILIIGPTSLCATVIVDKLNVVQPGAPTATHIHIGQPSYTGPVIVQLPAPKANGGGSPGTMAACKTDVSAEMISKMQANPEFFYVDVHAQGYQFGALRGQLF